MVPVPFKVVPTAVSTLLSAFLQVLEAAGDASYGMAMSSIVIAASTASTFSCRHNFSFFSVVETKNRTERGQGNTGDFFLFPRPEKMLKLWRHENIEAVTMELTAIPKEAFTSCFQDLQKRCQQCIDCGGDYFEGDGNH
jgi:hypothetical protein